MDKKVTRKALWASGLSIVVCLAMLISATFAWFSDVASNKGNVIASGNLAISVIGYDANGDPTVNFKDEHDPVINESNWEPGLANTKFVKIENIGNLGLKYNLTFVTYDQGLQEALWYKITEATTLPGGSVPTFEERKQMGLISSDIQDGDLTPGESIIYRIDYGMNESAGNTYMDKGFSADIIVTATQTNGDAKVVKAYTVHDIETAAQNDTVVLMKDITLDKNLAINTNINLDTNGYEFNLGGFSLTFGQTTYYATYDIKGVFKNGIIILDNSNGHFNMTGDAGTDANIVVENTYEGSAVLSGQWGNVNVNDTKGRTYIEGSVGNINAGAGSTVIIRDGAEIGDISGDGDVLDEEGMPYGAIVLEAGADIQSAIKDASSGTTFYLPNGTYSGVTIHGTSFGKQITLIGQSRDGVKLEWLRITNANADITLKNINITSYNSGASSIERDMLYISAGTVRLYNCKFNKTSGNYTIQASAAAKVYINKTEFLNSGSRPSYFNGNSLKVFTNNKYNSSSNALNCDNIQASLMETVMTGNDFANSNLYFNASAYSIKSDANSTVAQFTEAEQNVIWYLLRNNTNLRIRLAFSSGSRYLTLDSNGNLKMSSF